MSASPTPQVYPDLDSDQSSDETSIVSSLVRTGEASRLRRRGAILLTHGGRARVTADAMARQQQQQQRGEPTGPQGALGTSDSDLFPRPIIVRSPSPWTNQVPNLTSAMSMPSAYPPWDEQIKIDDEPDGAHGTRYELYCGRDRWDAFPSSDDEDGDDESDWEPELFPSFPQDTNSAEKERKARKPMVRSTGCGTLVHTNGTPRTRCATWQAQGPATETVVALDKSYFKRGGETKQFTCGCRWYGVGCANCGNALGNIYIPCQAAAASPSNSSTNLPSTSTSSSSHPPPIRPSSATAFPTNRPTPARKSRDSIHHLYTFFSDAVSSNPSFPFPTTGPSSRRDRFSNSVPPTRPTSPPSPGEFDWGPDTGTEDPNRSSLRVFGPRSDYPAPGAGATTIDISRSTTTTTTTRGGNLSTFGTSNRNISGMFTYNYNYTYGDGYSLSGSVNPNPGVPEVGGFGDSSSAIGDERDGMDEMIVGGGVSEMDGYGGIGGADGQGMGSDMDLECLDADGMYISGPRETDDSEADKPPTTTAATRGWPLWPER